MSADSRPVPTNLLSQLTVCDLLPDQKLILLYLWMNRFTNSAGCYELPTTMAAAELSLKESSLINALEEFERRGLVHFDKTTGEVFIERWFSFHSFKKTIALQCLFRDVEKIKSERLKTLSFNKINHLSPNNNNNTLSTTKTLSAYKKRSIEKAKERDALVQMINLRLMTVEKKVAV